MIAPHPKPKPGAFIFLILLMILAHTAYHVVVVITLLLLLLSPVSCALGAGRWALMADDMMHDNDHDHADDAKRANAPGTSHQTSRLFLLLVQHRSGGAATSLWCWW